ncbi:MAG TPA: tetratricopeptide repeat protein [Desulfotomaculum sp.]|nr:tetratricopeptide repeat protein [Desulfotomaculum sp.]
MEQSDLSTAPAPGREEKTIPLGKALIILGVVIGVVAAVGLTIGYVFFWGKYPEQGYEDIVLKAAEHRVSNNPQDPLARVELGYAYLLRQGEDKAYIEKALKEFKKAYELDPKNRQVRYNLALGYIAGEEYKEAIALLEPLAEERIFDYDTHFSLGEAYLRNRQYAEAAAAFEEAAAIRPGYADTYYFMAQAYAEIGEKEKALAAVEKALRLVPHYKEVQELKARLTEQGAGGEEDKP